VAQIITFGTLQARGVLRDVGRVLQLPYGQVDKLCKLVPQNPSNPVTLKRAIEDEPRLQAERDRDPVVRRAFDIAQKLEGLHRHAARPPRGPDRAGRALSAGPDGQYPDLLRPQAGAGGARLHPPEARAGVARDLRRHRLPGAGDAGGADSRRLLAWRSRSPAP